MGVLQECYRAGEFQRTWKISKTFFYEEVKKGRLKTIKAGRAILITRAAVEAWLALCEAETEQRRNVG